MELPDALKEMLGISEGEVLKLLPEDMQEYGRIILDAAKANKDFHEALASIGVLLPKNGMRPELIEELIDMSLNNAIERLLALVARTSTKRNLRGAKEEEGKPSSELE